MIYHKFSHGAAPYTLNGENVNVMLESCFLDTTYRQKTTFCRILLTLKVVNIGIDRSEQTVQTQIRLLLKEKSDQCLHCFPFYLYL